MLFFPSTMFIPQICTGSLIPCIHISTQMSPPQKDLTCTLSCYLILLFSIALIVAWISIIDLLIVHILSFCLFFGSYISRISNNVWYIQSTKNYLLNKLISTCSLKQQTHKYRLEWSRSGCRRKIDEISEKIISEILLLYIWIFWISLYVSTCWTQFENYNAQSAVP